MTDIRYTSTEEPDEPEKPVLASFPIGSRQDATLRDALTRIGEASSDPALSSQITKTLAGSQSLRGLMASPEFAGLLEKTSARIERSLSDLTPDQREELERRQAADESREGQL